MKCKYRSNYTDNDALNCDLDALSGSDCCIIHSDFPKDLNMLKNAVDNKVIKHDFNFEGSKLDSFIYHDLKTKKPIIFRNAFVKRDVKLSSNDPEIKDDAEFGHLNFRGSNIGGNVEFIQTIINGRVNFGNDTKIGGNIKFTSSFIKGNVDLTDIDVDGNVCFPYTKIKGNVNFARAKIGKQLGFTNSEIAKDVTFNNINVGQKLSFNLDLKFKQYIGKKLEVKGKADFNNIIIGGEAIFNGMNIGESFDLMSSNIYGSANFEESEIGTLNNETITDKTANFSNTEILGDSDFSRANFHGEGIFIKTKFRENAYFDEAIFDNIADFEESRFYENASFVNTNFSNKVRFSKASFLSTGLFRGLKNNLKLDGSFMGSRLKNVAFRGCNLTKTQFEYVIFDNCELSSSIWPKDYKIPELIEYEKNKFKKIPVNSLLTNSLGILWSQELVEEAKLVADTYQRIRLSLQQSGAYDLAGKFYVKEMDLKREVYSQENRAMWLIYSILSFMTGYGEKLRNILIFFLLYLGIYTVAVFYLMPNNYLVIPIGSGILSIFTALLVYVFARKISR
jgi:uncharacterized protein YjbI with pentapeptide repeats